MMTMPKREALELVSGAAPDAVTQRFERALRAVPANEIEVGRVKRDHLVRIYSIRRETLGQAGIPTDGIDAFVSRLRALDEDAWLFGLNEEDGEAFVAVTDAERSRLIAVLAVPYKREGSPGGV
jgi:hypothetical protein